ncbi:MAG: pseudouridine synthase, partial [Pseudomonadota bacterium]
MREVPPYRPPHPPYLPVADIDDEVIAVVKPAGLLSVPGKPPDMDDCVETRAQRAFGRAFICHRLDMATSGLILLARTKAAQRSLSMQFEAREISKTYHALVRGEV